MPANYNPANPLFMPLYMPLEERDEKIEVKDEVVLDFVVHPGLDIEKRETTPPWIVTAIDRYGQCYGIGKDGMHRKGEANQLRKIRHWDSMNLHSHAALSRPMKMVSLTAVPFVISSRSGADDSPVRPCVSGPSISPLSVDR